MEGRGESTQNLSGASQPLLTRARQHLPRFRILLILIARIRPEITFPPIPPIVSTVHVAPWLRPSTALPSLVLVFIERRRRRRERRLK